MDIDFATRLRAVSLGFVHAVATQGPVKVHATSLSQTLRAGERPADRAMSPVIYFYGSDMAVGLRRLIDGGEITTAEQAHLALLALDVAETATVVARLEAAQVPDEGAIVGYFGSIIGLATGARLTLEHIEKAPPPDLAKLLPLRFVGYSRFRQIVISSDLYQRGINPNTVSAFVLFLDKLAPGTSSRWNDFFQSARRGECLMPLPPSLQTWIKGKTFFDLANDDMVLERSEFLAAFLEFLMLNQESIVTSNHALISSYVSYRRTADQGSVANNYPCFFVTNPRGFLDYQHIYRSSPAYRAFLERYPLLAGVLLEHNPDPGSRRDVTVQRLLFEAWMKMSVDVASLGVLLIT